MTLIAASPLGAKEDEEPDGLAGVWTGSVEQEGFGRYPVEIRIGNDRARIAVKYPTLFCGGFLVPTEIPGAELVLSERIEHNTQGRCLSNGRVKLVPNAYGGLRYEWYRPGARTSEAGPGAVAILSRAAIPSGEEKERVSPSDTKVSQQGSWEPPRPQPFDPSPLQIVGFPIVKYMKSPWGTGCGTRAVVGVGVPQGTAPLADDEIALRALEEARRFALKNCPMARALEAHVVTGVPPDRVEDLVRDRTVFGLYDNEQGDFRYSSHRNYVKEAVQSRQEQERIARARRATEERPEQRPGAIAVVIGLILGIVLIMLITSFNEGGGSSGSSAGSGSETESRSSRRRRGSGKRGRASWAGNQTGRASCRACRNSGWCSRCLGSGFVTVLEGLAEGLAGRAGKCPQCGGGQKCPTCHGEG